MNDDIVEVSAVDADDPNADLIGFEFNTEDLGLVIVVGTPVWSDGNYVEVRTVDNADEKPVATSCRPSGLVRQRMREEAAMDIEPEKGSFSADT
jgi:hypothetical protein